MGNGNRKRLPGAILIAPILLLCSAAAWGEEALGTTPSERHPLPQDWQGLATPGFEVEEGENFRIRADAYKRYDELEQVFSETLAEKVDLAPGLWELLPNIHYLRMLLTRTAMQGELACERNRQCKMQAASSAPPNDSEPDPACTDTDWCAQQHGEAVSTCKAILAEECHFPLGQLCRRYRQEAHDVCMSIAECQHGCCSDGCGATNCAEWIRERTDEQCTNCNPSS